MSTETASTSSDPNVTITTTEGATGSGQTGTAPQESWAKSWLKNDGSLDHSVFDKAPDDFKGMRKDVERYKTFDEYLKGQRERDSLLGKKGIIDPLPENATQAQKDERSALLRKVNGAPEKPDGYGLKRPDNIPEAMWDQPYADTIAGIAHKHGLAPAALKDLAEAEVKYAQAAQEHNKKEEAKWYEGQDKLIRETAAKEGMDFAKAKDLAERAGRKFGVDPTNPLMKNASVFMLLARIGRMSGEDNLVTGDAGSLTDSLRMSPDRASASAKDIQQNKENPDYKAYWNANDARHAAVVDKVNGMLALATKDKPQRR